MLLDLLLLSPLRILGGERVQGLLKRGFLLLLPRLFELELAGDERRVEPREEIPVPGPAGGGHFPVSAMPARLGAGDVQIEGHTRSPLLPFVLLLGVEFSGSQPVGEMDQLSLPGFDDLAAGLDLGLAAPDAEHAGIGVETKNSHAFELGHRGAEADLNAAALGGLDDLDQRRAFQQIDCGVIETRIGHAKGAPLEEPQKDTRREQHLGARIHAGSQHLPVFQEREIGPCRPNRPAVCANVAHREVNGAGPRADHVLRHRVFGTETDYRERPCGFHAAPLYPLAYNNRQLNTMGRQRLARIALAVAWAAGSAFGQVKIEPRSRASSKEPAIPSANLRVDTTLVLVPVTVNDELNHPITGLDKENFRVFDDKVQQTIGAFSTEDEPIALGLVFDTSGSMHNAIPEGRRAAAEFLQLADEHDEFFLVEFDSSARLAVPLTAETGSIRTEVLMTKSAGSTALIDGLYLAINEMKKSKKTKKAIVLISDGGENHSRYTPTEIKNLVTESDVLIYTVALGGRMDAEAGFGLGLMNRIAEMTGAHMYYGGASDLRDIALKIAIELRNRYVLGYTPMEQERDGRYHRIEVKVTPPRGLGKLRAHWRTGYYAPSD